MKSWMLCIALLWAFHVHADEVANVHLDRTAQYLNIEGQGFKLEGQGDDEPPVRNIHVDGRDLRVKNYYNFSCEFPTDIFCKLKVYLVEEELASERLRTSYLFFKDTLREYAEFRSFGHNDRQFALTGRALDEDVELEITLERGINQDRFLVRGDIELHSTTNTSLLVRIYGNPLRNNRDKHLGALAALAISLAHFRMPDMREEL